MKRLLCLLGFCAVVNPIAHAGLSAATGIMGSVHDMNLYVGRDGDPDEVRSTCVFCHTPHHASKTDDDVPTPLWNQELTTQELSDRGVYQWATPKNYPLTIDPLAGPSRLCMSCHDGAIAIDEHRSLLAGGSGGEKIGDLTESHPIGFSYGRALSLRNRSGPELVEKSELFASAVVPSKKAGTSDRVMRAQGSRTIGEVLYQGDIMTCATCHEVHNKHNAVQDASALTGRRPNYLLYAKEKQSLICLSCHIR